PPCCPYPTLFRSSSPARARRSTARQRELRLDRSCAPGLSESMDSTPGAWRAVDDFLAETLVGHDSALGAALAAQREAGLPEIEVAPVAGKLLNLLVRIAG